MKCVIYIGLSDIKGLARLDFDPAEGSGRRQVCVRRVDEGEVRDASVNDEPLPPVLFRNGEETACRRGRRAQLNQTTGDKSGEELAILPTLPVDWVGKWPVQAEIRS